jgi:transketolase
MTATPSSSSHANDTKALADIAARIRGNVVSLSHQSRAPHLASSLSCVDVLVAAYWGGMFNVDEKNPDDPNRDRIILSKGHAAAALYATLAEKGYFDPEILKEYNVDGGRLAEHPGPGCVPGIEAATGSLGHGLPIGLGMALAARIQKRPSQVLVVMSDGECNEGSVWEAAMMAPAKNAGNLTVVVDFNKWQATGRSQEVMALMPLEEKFRDFGWRTCSLDGHDHGALVSALSRRGNEPTQPLAIIADTIKGKGVSFMEDDNNWHYRIPKEDEVQTAHRELGLI